MTSYLDSQLIRNQEEEERFFHLLQLFFGLKFPLSQFVKFTGIKLSNHSDREKLLFYFSQFQKLDPIITNLLDVLTEPKI